jgi:predicted MFS family arabinose efflux permease
VPAAASATDTPWYRQPLFVLVAAGLILGLSMGVRQTFGLFVQPMADATGISVAGISLAIAFQNLLWGVATPFVGMAADRYGNGPFLLAGGLFYAAGMAVTAYADTPLLLHLGAGALVGLGVSAAGFTLVLAAVARAAPDDRRSTWLGIASAGGSAGQFLLLPGAQSLIGAFDYQIALLVLAGLAFLIVPLTASVADRKVREGGRKAAAALESQSLTAALGEAGAHRGYLLLTGGFFVCGFHVAFMTTHLPGYIVSCNLSAQTGAVALGLIGFFNIVGGLLAGWLGQRFRKKYLLSTIYLARAVAIALFLLGPKVDWAVWLFSATFGLLWLSTVPLTSGLVGQIFGPRYMATLFGIVMLSHQVGAFFGAWAGGLSVDLFGSYDPVWLASIALGLIAAALHFPIADRPLDRPAAIAPAQ